MDTLTAIFGNPAKVKLLRFFLFNESLAFTAKEITERTKCPYIIRKKHISKEIQVVKGKKLSIKKIEGQGYILNNKFPYLDPLKNLLTITSLRADESLARRFTNAGKIKLFIASGVFIQNWDTRVDLLIVGDELNLSKIESVIKTIESEIGKEIAYSAFETQDFEYRFGIHDRLVRDILDYPHVTLLDRIGIEPQ